MSEKRLLLVEDEPGLQLALSDRLSAEGYAVETAGDGNLAVTRATGEPFEDTYRWTLPDGRHVWMLDRARATRWDPERREGEFHGAMVDVTDLMEGCVSREG